MKRIIALVLLVTLLVGCTNTAASSTATKEIEATPTDEVSALLSSLSFEIDDEDSDESYSNALNITFSGDSITGEGNGFSIDGTTITINSGGTYLFTGTLNDGQIIVNSTDDKTVKLVLNNVALSSSEGSAIYIEQAEKTIITSPTGSSNTISDASVRSETIADDQSAAIKSKDDLVFNGQGLLTITSNYNDAIKSNDDLKIINANLDVSSIDDGIVGKDLVGISNSKITINATGDGIKASNDTDEDKGNVIIISGTFAIISGTDGIQAEKTLVINDGTFNIVSGGGSSEIAATMNNNDNFGNRQMFNYDNETGATPSMMPDGSMPERTGKYEMQDMQPQSTTTEDDTPSTKGLKGTDLVISGGTFDLDCLDDGVHGNGSITINNGTFTISTNDDAVHADISLIINNGTIDIKQSNEGLEANTITINDGLINVVSIDDGINGNDNNASVEIKGGNITVDASGDGIDSNGSITMSGGNVIVYGPESNNDGALDYDSTCVITGGTLIASGAVGMAQTPSNTSSVPVINLGTSASVVTIKDNNDNEVISFTSNKSYQSLIIASDKLENGATYRIYEDDTLLQEVTLEDIITSINASQGFGGGMGGGKGNMPDGEMPMGHGPQMPNGNNSNQDSEPSAMPQ